MEPNLNFGEALEAVKIGELISREGWNKEGKFVFLRPADELHIDMVVNKVKSLPQSVKDYYGQDMVDKDGNPIDLEEDDVVKFTAYLCLKDADGTIINGWQPSQADMLAKDWCLLP